MKLLYWFVCYTCYVVLRSFYRLEVRGKENIPSGPAIIAPNHVSYLDPPIIGASCPKEVHFLANARLFKYPYFGKFISTLNSHPVNTSSQDSKALKTVLNLLQKGCRVLIFPEGLRSPTGELQPLKLGCAMLSIHTQAPIIPTYIEGAYEIWPRNREKPHLKGKLIITYGPPLYPNEVEGNSKKEEQLLLTQKLEQAILKLKNS